MRCGADARKSMDQLCRSITCPALANERLRCNADGRVVLRLKTPWLDGTTHPVMSPLEFMQRLAALVPRPRRHAPGQYARRKRERLLRGDQFRAMNVAEGSIADAGRSRPTPQAAAVSTIGRDRKRIINTAAAATRHAAPAVNSAGLYVSSSVRVRPAP